MCEKSASRNGPLPRWCSWGPDTSTHAGSPRRAKPLRDRPRLCSRRSSRISTPLLRYSEPVLIPKFAIGRGDRCGTAPSRPAVLGLEITKFGPIPRGPGDRWMCATHLVQRRDATPAPLSDPAEELASSGCSPRLSYQNMQPVESLRSRSARRCSASPWAVVVPGGGPCDRRHGPEDNHR
jgi:hypothetical protein